jgi:hypothetical protein
MQSKPLHCSFCSFCALAREGGVSGQGTRQWAYICPDGVRLTHRMLEGRPPRHPAGETPD